MHQPLVTVVCLCYNHVDFVREAVESVIHQTYSNIQIIIVDDNSVDNSVQVIQSIVKEYPTIEFISLAQNLGNCKAFNTGWKKSKGDFIVDFATDDVMLPERIEHQIQFFQTLDHSYGIVFTDAIYMDANGNFLYNHFERLSKRKLINEVPQGDIYCNLLSKYFISSPTMIVRREVFEYLQGYDETLAYEDFDFWIRSSREFKYAYLNERLTKVRRLSDSMSAVAYRRNDPQLHSTYLICRKAIALNRTTEERESLLIRIHYELRQSVFSGNRKEAKLFYDLLLELEDLHLVDTTILWFGKLPLPFVFVRTFYQKLIN